MKRTALDQYEEIVTDALPRKINFTQMGRYSDSSEQRFRQLFEREFDWMSSISSLCGSGLVKALEKPLP